MNYSLRIIMYELNKIIQINIKRNPKFTTNGWYTTNYINTVNKRTIPYATIRNISVNNTLVSVPILS